VSRSVKAHVLLILVTLVWGATFVQIKDALTDVSPLLFNAVRMGLAAVVLAAIYLPRLKNVNRATLGAGALAGTFLWIGYEFQTTGLKLTTPAKSAFLTSISVVLVPIFLALFWRKRTSGWTALGVVLAFCGLYLLTVPAGGPQGLGDFHNVNRGDGLSLACAVAFGLQIIFLGRASSRYGFEPIAVLQTATAAALMFASVPVLEHAYLNWSAKVIAAILVTGLLGTAAAFTIQAWAQQFLPPTNTALIFSLEPVFAWLTAYVALGEKLELRSAVGAVLIVGGLLASELLGAAGPAQAPA
jgi:drug/metabolite transporter (DMT)-like permease